MLKRIIMVYLVLVCIGLIIICSISKKVIKDHNDYMNELEQYNPDLEAELMLQEINNDVNNRMNDLFK